MKTIMPLLLFLITYISIYIGLEIFMKETRNIMGLTIRIDHPWLPGLGGDSYADIMFRFEQCVYSIFLFLIYYIFKKKINCKTGLVILFLTFVITAFRYYRCYYGHTWTDDFMTDAENYFFHDYLFTIKGIIHLESVIIVSFLLAWLIYKLVYK